MFTTLADAGIMAKTGNMPAGSAATPPPPFVSEHESATDGTAGDTAEVQSIPEAFGWLPHSMPMTREAATRSRVDNFEFASSLYTFREVGAACRWDTPD